MKEFLDLFANADVLKVKDSAFEPYHIFRKLVKHYEKELSFGDCVLLFLHFEKYEKCLHYSRKRELQSAEFVLSQLHALDQGLPDIVSGGMNSLYWAMYAYYVYACGKYDEAIFNLQKAIGYAKQQGMAFPLMLASIQEQWLNIFRVYVRRKDIDSALDEAKRLIEFSLYGNYDDVRVEQIFRTLGYDSHSLMLHHVFNSVFLDLLRFHGNDMPATMDTVRDIIRFLATKDQAKSLNRPASNLIILLNQFYEDRRNAFAEGLALNFESLQKAPVRLQAIAITCYLDTVGEFEPDFDSHCNYNNFVTACKDLNIDLGNIHLTPA